MGVVPRTVPIFLRIHRILCRQIQLQTLLRYGTMKSGRQDKHGFHSYWRRCKRRMIHLKPKRLLISLIVVIFCVLAAMTPLGARTSMVLRFQIAELSADNSNDEYNMDSEHFYVRNQKTIHSLKQMLFRTSRERIPMQTVCTSTLCLCSRPSGL